MRSTVVWAVVCVAWPAAVAAHGAEVPAVVELCGTEPVEAPAEVGHGECSSRAEDLARLASWIGEAEVVALGESVHGTHTLHRLADRIFRHLVEREGFGVFALEIDQAHAALLDEYAQGERDDLEALLAGGWWGQKIFYDAALAELLRWMRRHNATAEQPIHVAGFDLKQPRLALERLMEGIAEVDRAFARQLSAVGERVLAPGAFGAFPNVSGYTAAGRLPWESRAAASELVVRIEVRGEGVGFGTVGFGVRVGNTWRLEVAEVALDELPVAGAHELKVQVPGSTERLELVLFHRGNGTVWFSEPAFRGGGGSFERLDGFFEILEPWPLMMPAIQRMDYRATLEPGSRALRVAADPVLDESLAASRELEEGLRGWLVGGRSETLGGSRRAWALQLARLLTQAVHWRTLVEPNRDVFLAENVLWLRRVTFPDRRILLLSHVSHGERRPGRMGELLAASLGEAYRSVSMIAGSGAYRYFGAVETITRDAPLEEHEVDPERRDPFLQRLGELSTSDFWMATAGAESPAAAAADAAVPGADAIVFVHRVEPLRATP